MFEVWLYDLKGHRVMVGVSNHSRGGADVVCDMTGTVLYAFRLDATLCILRRGGTFIRQIDFDKGAIRGGDKPARSEELELKDLVGA